MPRSIGDVKIETCFVVRRSLTGVTAQSNELP